MDHAERGGSGAAHGGIGRAVGFGLQARVVGGFQAGQAPALQAGLLHGVCQFMRQQVLAGRRVPAG